MGQQQQFRKCSCRNGQARQTVQYHRSSLEIPGVPFQGCLRRLFSAGKSVPVGQWCGAHRTCIQSAHLHLRLLLSHRPHTPPSNMSDREDDRMDRPKPEPAEGKEGRKDDRRDRRSRSHSRDRRRDRRSRSRTRSRSRKSHRRQRSRCAGEPGDIISRWCREEDA